MEVILSMTLGITILLLILTFGKIKENFANIFLFSLLFSVAIGSAFVISLKYVLIPSKFIIIFVDAIPVLFGTFTYLYVRYSILSLTKLNKFDLLHFSIFFITILLSFFEGSEFSIISIILNIVLKILVSIIYLILALKLLKNKNEISKNQLSNTDKIDLNWLVFIVKIGLISYFLYLIIMIIWVLNINILENIFIYSNLLVFVYILPIGYYGLRKTTVFVTIANLNNDKIIEAEILTLSQNTILKKSVSKELINSEKAEIIYQNLLELINTKKIYRNENLMLEDIAKELNLHSKYLSYVINTKSGKTFYDFINYFRIIEFNEQAINPVNKNLTFLAIAYNCGFGSKSSFNRAYKNLMGKSPSEFLNKQKN